MNPQEKTNHEAAFTTTSKQEQASLHLQKIDIYDIEDIEDIDTDINPVIGGQQFQWVDIDDLNKDICFPKDFKIDLSKVIEIDVKIIDWIDEENLNDPEKIYGDARVVIF